MKIVFAGLAAVLIAQATFAHEFSGHIAAEGRAFQHDALFEEQKNQSASVSVEAEYYHEFDGAAGFVFVPFGRWDSADNERTHFDIRELNVLWPAPAWDLRVGIGKVFWGATEFVHLVDIINQTDLVESIDEEEKLGQPMAQLSAPSDFGVFDFFVLPYFRERTFPGPEGRLRTDPPVDSDASQFESDAKERHVDFAARYANTFGDMDLGVYNFRGTGREPTMKFGLDNSGKPRLVPYYEQISQYGLDAQMVAGQWLFKLEALRRSGQGDSYAAATGGFEYTLVRVAGTEMDLGLLGEWAWDERGDDAPGPFDNDAMLGLRLAVNDQGGTEILGGIIQDADSPANIITVEASSRLGDAWKASLELRSFLGAEEDDPLYSFRDDDYVEVQVIRYF